MTYQTAQPRNEKIWTGDGGPRQPLRRDFLLIPITIALAWLAFSPARAVTPAPDGGYPGQNTAEGDDALMMTRSPRSQPALTTRQLVLVRSLATPSAAITRLPV
jgi:hypothetical protein